MTSSKRFESCEKCEGPLAARPAAPFPIALQIAFGLSFVVFLFFMDRFRNQPIALWIWSAVQAVLGVLLIRGRRQAAKKVLVCIRCGHTLPS